MKKFLLSLVSLLMFVIGGVWADAAFYTLDTTLEEVATDENAYANVNNASVGGIDWAFQGNGQQHPWRLGGKALTDVDRVVYTKTAMGADINSVKLTVAEANNITVNSLKLVVARDPDFADVTDEVAKDFAAESEITFVPSTGTSWAKDSYYKFVFNVSVVGNSNRFVQFSKVEFFAAASEPAAETITLNGIEYELKSENLFVNGSFTNGVAGWKTIGYTTDAVESNFTLTAEGGYDGGAFITTNGAGVGSENTIRQSVAVTQGKTYYFAVRTSGKAPDTSNFNYNALFKMTDAVTENGVIKAFEWPQGAGQTSAEWSTTAIVFTAETDYVGVRMGWNAASSFDGFELYEVEQLTSPLDAAKLEKLAAIDALQIVGDGLFQYSQTAIDDAKAAVNAATTVEEVEAVAMPAVTAPDAEKFYSFKLKEGGNYLAADGGIKLAEKAMGFKFVAAEGGYALTADGTNYVAFTGTGNNIWSMGLTEAPYTWVVTCLADGEYTLSKVGKPAECIGVDDTTAGSPCFADKPADAKGTWAIAEYVAPVLYNVTVAEGLENGTVVASPVQAEEGETVTLTITPAEGYELDVLTVKAGENDVEVSGNTFAMPAANVTVSATFKEKAPSNDFTSYIVNADLTGEGGFDATGTKGIDGSGIVKCANNAQFDFKQTIAALPAGQYKLTAQAAYRYSGSEADEYAAIEAGTDTKLATLYATTTKKTYDSKVMNRWDGASETDYAAGDGSTTVNEKFVPNSSNAVKAWFAAGQYVNEVVFNLAEAGDVTIGIVKNAQPEAGDYTVLGPWTLTRLGDAEEEEEPTPALANGKYYLQNVATGLYWGAGNDWGTQACLLAHPDYVTLVSNEDGTYKLESQVSNGGTSYYFNGSYMDGNPVALTFTQSGDNYTIANGETYYGAPSSRATVTFEGTMVLGTTAADSQDALWKVIPEADMLPSLANATVEAPVDATFLIIDHTFGRNNRNVSAWNNDGGAALTGGNSNRHCAEKYHGVYNVSQTLANAPKGVYRLEAQGFYRQDGSDNENLPVIYANDVTAQFPLLTTSENSMDAACTSFNSGLYKIDPIFVKVEEGGTLTIGAKLETNTALWCIWDNFVLTYYGDCDLAEAKFSGLVAQVNALKAEAEVLVANTGNVSETTVAALQAAIAATENIEATEEAYKAVINGLTAAVNQGKLDVNNKAAIDAMYALIESTNVYTAEAKATYTAEADGYKAAWEAGTLTTKVDNPATIHAWHAANTADDFLLSAWTINDVQAKEFDTALYINTWSDEGEKDGSEFKVPFFEYWTGDANSLGAAKLTATMTGLTAGLYEVSAWVRVRAKNGFTAPATGITMDVNGGEATDVAAGTQVENTQFFLANFKAVGVVGEDGVLKANFNVAADNNISWLSFKNVKFAPKDETEYAYEQALASIEDGKGYRVFTEVGENKFYLTTTGTLVASKEQAASFNFKAVTIANGAYPTGWNLGCKFTNPTLSDGKTGDVVQNGKLNLGGNNDRNDWERQVFFLKDGKYAVRATNAKGSNWGANTYWTVTNTEAELPNADYSLDMNYVWQLEDSSFDLLMKDLNDIIARGNAFAVECGEESLAALNFIDVAALTTSEQVAAAIAEAKSIIANYIAGVEYTRLLNVTTAVVANPTPMTIDGWEGDSFGDASDGVCEYWNKAAADFHQTVTLPAGSYRLTVVALQRVNQTGVVYAGENKTTIVQVASSVANKRAQAADWFAAGNGKNEVYFNMAEAGDIVIGLTADGTTSDYWTVWQSFKVEKVADVAYEKAYTALAAALQTGKPDSTSAGDGLFMKPTEAYKAALAAYNAAKAALDNAESTADQLTAALAAFNESVATYAAVPVTTPKADVRYVFKQKATGKFLSVYVEKNDAEEVTANGVRLSDEAQGFTWNETEGGYYLSNEVGYVGLAGTNVWTMSALEANKVVINATPAEIVEGVVYYTLNEKNGVIGADDDMVCYANKGKDDKSLWYIDEYVAPANIEIASVTYGGEVVTFDDNNAATIDGAYDAEKELVVTAEDSEAVEVTITYPTEVGQTELVITVTDKNNVLYPDNKATYTITFSVATGINALAAEDGKAVIYDMNGRRVSRNAKGVLIINGKKQLIK